jgi:hypothetical protein
MHQTLFLLFFDANLTALNGWRRALQPQNFNLPGSIFKVAGHHRKSRESGDERFPQRVIVMSSPTTHPSKWT